jgi:hypothetical protein
VLSLLPPLLQDVENIAALPVEAAEAEEMLHDNANLLQVAGARGLCAAVPGTRAAHAPC